MSENFGSGVSRTLEAKDRQYSTVVWQKGKPPLDSELNLISQIIQETYDKLSEASTPSGWVGDPIRITEDFITNSSWSNRFRFGTQRNSEKRGFPIAVVNGWVVPVVATRVGDPPTSPNDTDFFNQIDLDPPPSGVGDFRTDFVFLEVWRAQLSPGGTTSKPTATEIYKFGNTEHGGTNLSDDIQDPAIGFETTERVQVQYRIRVVSGVSLSGHNDGFDDSAVFARGASSTNTAFTFENMREELGDPGLWRAGDGDYTNSLGAVDGYSFAIPICSVFRRNSQAYAADSNQNGGVNRNLAATTRDDATEFINTPTLDTAIDDDDVSLDLVTITSTGLPNVQSVIRIDDEILTYAGITSNTLTGLVREAYNSAPQEHKAGATVTLLPMRPDGLFSDQVANKDIFDLRHVVSLESMDFQRLLSHNFTKLLRGELKSTWKRSGASGIRGPEILFVDRLTSTSPPAGVSELDDTDNHRIIFSDAALMQPGNICMVAPPATDGSEQSATLAGFGLEVTATAQVATASTWTAGDWIRIPISQFKNGFQGGHDDSVRFLADSELETTVRIYIDGAETEYTANGGGNDYFTAEAYTGGGVPDPDDDLKITFGGDWPTTADTNLIISFVLQYGPGRGLSRTPNFMHEINFSTSTTDILTRYFNKLHMEPIHLWGRINPEGYREEPVKNSEAYIDLGSKTAIISPWRRLGVPDIKVIDGSGFNGGSGLMPVGAAPKDEVDPLDLFKGSDNGATQHCVSFPHDWICFPRTGDVYVPILHETVGNFYRGINFFMSCSEGAHATLDDSEKNYVNTSYADSQQFFSTSTDGSTPAAYNRKITTGTGEIAAHSVAGMRKYSSGDREGLELPPFYGVARLFAVYEGVDFEANGSAFDTTTRAPLAGGAVNLLRPEFDGPPIFIIEDDDGDCTFVLNAEAIDLNQLASPPASFADGEYVLEASVFGFDRGFLTDNCRLVLSRSVAHVVGDDIDSPNYILQSPVSSTVDIDIAYSRTPYQGDPFGSQENHLDRLYRPGCMSSADVRNILDNPLDYDTLTLDNQKSFEVLEGLSFATTLGSGTLSFPKTFYSNSDVLVGYEEPTSWPPTLPTDPRPLVQINATTTGFEISKPSDTNIIERLPLGSLFRDKDFLGMLMESLNGSISSNFRLWHFMPEHRVLVELPRSSQFLNDGENVTGHEYNNFDGVGSYLTLVDGIIDDLSSTTKFKTERGGSAYVSSRPIPGGPIENYLGILDLTAAKSSVMIGHALLVRSYPEEVSGNEVTAGDELQMVVMTHCYKPSQISSSAEVSIMNSPTGTGEGYSAVDRFRLEGHPLILNRTRYEPDTSAVTLAKKV